jgi:hypothetical protein
MRDHEYKRHGTVTLMAGIDLPSGHLTRWIVRSGFLLQLDCPDLALERHLTYNNRPVGEFLAFVERVVAAINKAIVNVPRDRVRLHVCWGKEITRGARSRRHIGRHIAAPRAGQCRRVRAALRQPPASE